VCLHQVQLSAADGDVPANWTFDGAVHNSDEPIPCLSEPPAW
jgi:hypothetical protein